MFLNIFFNYKILSSSEKELNLLKLLSLSNHKINIKYYKNNFIISVKENNAYFEELKKDINSYPNLYYQSLELFNLIIQTSKFITINTTEKRIIKINSIDDYFNLINNN